MSKRGFSTEDELRVIKELLDGRYQVIHSKDEFKKLKDGFDYKSLIPDAWRRCRSGCRRAAAAG